MEINLKLVESKVNLNGRAEKSVWEYLTTAERELYAEHLAAKKHFLSASRFTTDTEKQADFLRLHNKRFRL
jgi:hypothetical protein